MASNPALAPEIGPDGLAREAPVIAYTEKIIEEGRVQLKKHVHIVQESSNSQFAQLEELKRRLEALNPSRASTLLPHRDGRFPSFLMKVMKEHPRV